jgi:hypothetical protein
MSGKYEKSRFVGVRRTKIGEKRLSSTGENQKSAKNGFPPARENQKTPLATFPTLQKDENPESLMK